MATDGFVSRRPAGALAGHVDSIWHAQRGALPHRRERTLPAGCVDIVVPLLQEEILRFDDVQSTEARRFRGAVVVGAHDRHAVRGTGGASAVLGVHFRPGGAAAFFGHGVGALTNRTVLLEDAWGPAARELRERLQAARSPAQRIGIAEQVLLARLRVAPAADPMVDRACRRLEADPAAARIAELQRASGCPAPAFIRRFEAAVGLTPKRFARVLRFRALLSRAVRIGPRDWAELALEGGYCDQSHLIREFRRLAGVTPGAYLPVHADRPTHVPIADAPALPGRIVQDRRGDAG